MNVKNGGIGFLGVLQILFIALKLLGIINWSWWLVLLPLLISVGISLIAIIVFIIVCLRH